MPQSDFRLNAGLNVDQYVDKEIEQFAALRSWSSGPTFPANPQPYDKYIDTSGADAGTFYIRSGDNTKWNRMGSVDQEFFGIEGAELSGILPTIEFNTDRIDNLEDAAVAIRRSPTTLAWANSNTIATASWAASTPDPISDPSRHTTWATRGTGFSNGNDYIFTVRIPKEAAPSTYRLTFTDTDGSNILVRRLDQVAYRKDVTSRTYDYYQFKFPLVRATGAIQLQSTATTTHIQQTVWLGGLDDYAVGQVMTQNNLFSPLSETLAAKLPVGINPQSGTKTVQINLDGFNEGFLLDRVLPGRDADDRGKVLALSETSQNNLVLKAVADLPEAPSDLGRYELSVGGDGTVVNWVTAQGGSQGGGGLASVISNATLSGQGTTASPLRVTTPFSTADKSKLDSVESGAEPNVNADWAETDSNEDSFISNKPSLDDYDVSYVFTDGTSKPAELFDIRYLRQLLPDFETATAATKRNEVRIALKGRFDGLTDVSQVTAVVFDAYRLRTGPVTLGKGEYVDGTGRFQFFLTLTNLQWRTISANHAGAGTESQLQVLANGDTWTVRVPWLSLAEANPSFPYIPAEAVIGGVGTGTGTGLTPDQERKLAGIATGAEVNVQADWDQTTETDDSFIKNKPDVITQAERDKLAALDPNAQQVKSDWNAQSGPSQILNKPLLSEVATSGDFSDLSNKPFSQGAIYWAYANGTVAEIKYFRDDYINQTFTDFSSGSDVRTDIRLLVTGVIPGLTDISQVTALTLDGNTIRAAGALTVGEEVGSRIEVDGTPYVDGYFQLYGTFRNSLLRTLVASTDTEATVVLTYTNSAGRSTEWTLEVPWLSDEQAANLPLAAYIPATSIIGGGGGGGVPVGGITENELSNALKARLLPKTLGSAGQFLQVNSRANGLDYAFVNAPYLLDQARKDRKASDRGKALVVSSTDENDLDLVTISSGGPGGGGLNAVNTDSTITGDGTSGSPLSVDNPFTQTQEDKLDRIEPRAQANVQSDWTETRSNEDSFIQNKPSFATVATSGSYNDLTDKPTGGDPRVDNIVERVADIDIVAKSQGYGVAPTEELQFIPLSNYATGVGAYLNSVRDLTGTPLERFLDAFPSTNGAAIRGLSYASTATVATSVLILARLKPVENAGDYALEFGNVIRRLDSFIRLGVTGDYVYYLGPVFNPASATNIRTRKAIVSYTTSYHGDFGGQALERINELGDKLSEMTLANDETTRETADVTKAGMFVTDTPPFERGDGFADVDNFNLLNTTVTDGKSLFVRVIDTEDSRNYVVKSKKRGILPLTQVGGPLYEPGDGTVLSYPYRDPSVTGQFFRVLDNLDSDDVVELLFQQSVFHTQFDGRLGPNALASAGVIEPFRLFWAFSDGQLEEVTYFSTTLWDGLFGRGQDDSDLTRNTNAYLVLRGKTKGLVFNPQEFETLSIGEIRYDLTGDAAPFGNPFLATRAGLLLPNGEIPASGPQNYVNRAVKDSNGRTVQTEEFQFFFAFANGAIAAIRKQYAARGGSVPLRFIQTPRNRETGGELSLDVTINVPWVATTGAPYVPRTAIIGGITPETDSTLTGKGSVSDPMKVTTPVNKANIYNQTKAIVKAASPLIITNSDGAQSQTVGVNSAALQTAVIRSSAQDRNLTAADRGKLLAVSRMDQNKLALIDVPESVDLGPLEGRATALEGRADHVEELTNDIDLIGANVEYEDAPSSEAQFVTFEPNTAFGRKLLALARGGKADAADIAFFGTVSASFVSTATVTNAVVVLRLKPELNVIMYGIKAGDIEADVHDAHQYRQIGTDDEWAYYILGTLGGKLTARKRVLEYTTAWHGQLGGPGRDRIDRNAEALLDMEVVHDTTSRKTATAAQAGFAEFGDSSPFITKTVKQLQAGLSASEISALTSNSVSWNQDEILDDQSTAVVRVAHKVVNADRVLFWSRYTGLLRLDSTNQIYRNNTYQYHKVHTNRTGQAQATRIEVQSESSHTVFDGELGPKAIASIGPTGGLPDGQLFFAFNTGAVEPITVFRADYVDSLLGTLAPGTTKRTDLRLMLRGNAADFTATTQFKRINIAGQPLRSGTLTLTDGEFIDGSVDVDSTKQKSGLFNLYIPLSNTEFNTITDNPSDRLDVELVYAVDGNDKTLRLRVPRFTQAEQTASPIVPYFPASLIKGAVATTVGDRSITQGKLANSVADRLLPFPVGKPGQVLTVDSTGQFVEYATLVGKPREIEVFRSNDLGAYVVSKGWPDSSVSSQLNATSRSDYRTAFGPKIESSLFVSNKQYYFDLIFQGSFARSEGPDNYVNYWSVQRRDADNEFKPIIYTKSMLTSSRVGILNDCFSRSIGYIRVRNRVNSIVSSSVTSEGTISYSYSRADAGLTSSGYVNFSAFPQIQGTIRSKELKMYVVIYQVG